MPIRHSFFINTSEAYSKKHLLQRNMYAARFEDSEAIIHKRRQAFRRDALPLLENLARKHRVIEVIKLEIKSSDPYFVIYLSMSFIFRWMVIEVTRVFFVKLMRSFNTGYGN